MMWKAGKWQHFAPRLVALKSLIGLAWLIRAAVSELIAAKRGEVLLVSTLEGFGGKGYQRMKERDFGVRTENYVSSLI